MSVRLIAVFLALNGAVVAAEQTKPAAVEVQMILTAADHMNHRPATLTAADVTIAGATVTDWSCIS